MLYTFFTDSVGEIIVSNSNYYMSFLVLFAYSWYAEKTQVLLLSINGPDPDQVPDPAGAGAAAGAGR